MNGNTEKENEKNTQEKEEVAVSEQDVVSNVNLPDHDDTMEIVNYLVDTFSSSGKEFIQEIPRLKDSLDSLNSALLTAKDSIDANNETNKSELVVLRQVIKRRTDEMRKTIAVIGSLESIINTVANEVVELQTKVQDCERAYQVGSFKKGVLKGLHSITGLSVLRCVSRGELANQRASRWNPVNERSSKDLVELPYWNKREMDVKTTAEIFRENGLVSKGNGGCASGYNQSEDIDIDRCTESNAVSDEPPCVSSPLLPPTTTILPSTTAKQSPSTTLSPATVTSSKQKKQGSSSRSHRSRRTVEIEQLPSTPISSDLEKIRARKQST